MSDTSKTSFFAETPWAKLWSWALRVIPIYLIACGCMYLGGYWHYFQINFLEYITVSEVLARSAFDVVPIGFFMVEMAFLVILFSQSDRLRSWVANAEKRAREKRLASGKGPHWIERHPFFLHAFAPLSLIVVGVCVGVGTGITMDPPAGFVIAFPFIGGGLAGLLLEAVYPRWFKDSIGTAAAFLFFFGPTLCYIRGATTAEQMKFGPALGREHVRVHLENETELTSRMPEGYVYAGRMGGFVFFASKRFMQTIAMREEKAAYFESVVLKDPPPQTNSTPVNTAEHPSK